MPKKLCLQLTLERALSTPLEREAIAQERTIDGQLRYILRRWYLAGDPCPTDCYGERVDG